MRPRASRSANACMRVPSPSASRWRPHRTAQRRGASMYSAAHIWLWMICADNAPSDGAAAWRCWVLRAEGGGAAPSTFAPHRMWIGCLLAYVAGLGKGIDAWPEFRAHLHIGSRRPASSPQQLVLVQRLGALPCHQTLQKVGPAHAHVQLHFAPQHPRTYQRLRHPLPPPPKKGPPVLRGCLTNRVCLQCVNSVRAPKPQLVHMVVIEIGLSDRRSPRAWGPWAVTSSSRRQPDPATSVDDGSAHQNPRDAGRVQFLLNRVM